MNVKIISAGAGSGKTYRLTSELVALLAAGKVRASGVIATTFTNKAAAELQERVRVRLLEQGLTREANDLTNALIGTVHGLGVKLLKRFAYEAGVSPQVDIIAEEDQQVMFNQSLAMVLTNERVEEMERLADRLGLNKSEKFRTDWRKVLKDLTEIARANDFSKEVLEKSKLLSWETFQQFLDKPLPLSLKEWNDELNRQLTEAIQRLENNGDATKTTADAVKSLKELQAELNLRKELFWYNWVKISKLKIGTKSRDDANPLIEFANSHLACASFHDDIKTFLFHLFDLAQAAIKEYDGYKKRRGLIDYTDMEVLVKRLLDNEQVRSVLNEEIDLLLVDEFQDTSPIQLEIFLKLSKLARQSIWVGDPKQSIYGFRGAEPALMDSIVKACGGLKPENILELSWRSRADIVHTTNAIFTKAFAELPPEQVILRPQRNDQSTGAGFFPQYKPLPALHHWHFHYREEGRPPGKEWMNHCLAETLRIHLERGMPVLLKEEQQHRPARPGDVAILCRSNKECLDMAQALHRAGLKAAIARAGLLHTAEAKLILACLKFILHKYDSLSIAEILLLAGNLTIEEIIEDRLDYLDLQTANSHFSDSDEATLHRLDFKWGEKNEFVQRLNALRPKVAELSGSEILSLLLEELDLYRLIASWGNAGQRLSNVDQLSLLASRYEEACNRLHSAASLGGWLLWLNDLEKQGNDGQGSGESPDAVNVLTYHKSKGLEFPIVICHSLENPLRSDVWGLGIVAEQETVDLDNLLGNRWLRFWLNPYDDQYKGTLLSQRIDESPAKAKKLREALAEETRLLYVGITRAKDYLVFPTRQKQPVWLNRVCHQGNEDNPALEPASSATTWEWEGKPLYIQTSILPFPHDFPQTEPPVQEVYFLEKRAGKQFHLPHQLDLSKETYAGNVTLSAHDYASTLPLPENGELHKAGKAFQALLHAYHVSYGKNTLEEMTASLLERHGAASLLSGEAALQQAAAFFSWVKQQFSIQKAHRRYPLKYVSPEGRSFEPVIDLVLETQGNGLVLLLYTSFIGDAKNRNRKARDMAAWLHGCLVAAQKVFGKTNVQTWVHFVLHGSVIKVELQ